MSSDIFKRLEKIVGEEYITNSDFEKMFYSRDVSPIPSDLQKILGTIPDIIIRPKNTTQVAEIVKIAASNKIPIVPRGGASWWLGGAVPYKGGIVLDLSGMNHLIEVDEQNLTVTAECGVTWKELIDHLERRSLFIGTRPGSALSATIGGWISTGGVGIGSYKYGSVGDLVRALEVVLPNGEIINTGNKYLASNGSGYDLNGLFVGGEGTLGVITKATLKIVPKPNEGPYQFSFVFETIEDCTTAMGDLVKSRFQLYHIAFGNRRHFELLQHKGKKVPEGEIVLCISLEGDKGLIESSKERIYDSLTSLGGGLFCENMTEEICSNCTLEFRGRGGTVYPVPGEIFVSINNFTGTMSEIYEMQNDMNFQGAVIGSLVDRGTVMIMPYYINKKEEEHQFMGFHRCLNKIAIKFGGRGIGLGLYFANNLSHMFDPGYIAIMRVIKKGIDPDNIMNPGKILGDDELFNHLKEI